MKIGSLSTLNLHQIWQQLLPQLLWLLDVVAYDHVMVYDIMVYDVMVYDVMVYDVMVYDVML